MHLHRVVIMSVLGILGMGTVNAAEPTLREVPQNVTFSEHIAGIVFENCTTCHRTGQVAPFTLLNYNDTRKHAKTMLRTMRDRYMPPWQPETGHIAFRDERRLTDVQIATFEKWVETGMSEGDATKTPALPKFPEGWRLGTPDLVVQMNRPFAVPASGPDIYQNFVIPLNLTEDKWVTAVEFRASAPTVVHHVIYMLDDTHVARTRESTTGQPGFQGMGFRPTGSLGGWAVGATPVKLPYGLAMPLKKGSDLVLQTHFHLSGKPESELLTVGIYFADKPPTRLISGLQLPPVFGLFANINIPAGEKNFKVTDSFTLPVDVDVFGCGSHAHYLAKTMKTTATLPNGEVKTLFSITDWNFNWQGQYLYKEMVRLPKGTVIHGELTWDNSADNPRNPNIPPVNVTWGEGSFDEMGSVSLMMLPAKQSDTQILRDQIQAHRFNAFQTSMARGDKINWKKLGMTPQQLLLEAFTRRKLPFIKPETPKPAAPKSEPKTERKTAPSLSLRDVDGREQQPLTVKDAKANVLFFLTTDCPIANSYSPEINAIVKEYANAPIHFYAVQIDPELQPTAAKKHATEYGLTLPVVIDTKHKLVAATGVKHTPEVAVLLADGTIAYRGRIDDRYPGLGKKRTEPTQRELRDAISAIVNGDTIKVSRTDAVGCSIPDLPQ